MMHEKIGLIELCQIHTLHFAFRDVHKSLCHKDLEAPLATTWYCWADFLEHISIP